MSSALPELEEAAAALAAAEWVIVAAGAGFSADSGLPTYEECRAAGVEYDDLCRAELLYEDPELFYGFWAACTQKYREVEPHEGYAVLDRLLRPRAEAGRVHIYTSNVDGHFRCLKGFSLCEIHGSCEEWMCSASVPYAAMELLRDPLPADACGGADVVPLDGDRFKKVRAEQQRLLTLSGNSKGCESPEVMTAPGDWRVEVDASTRRARLSAGWPDAACAGETDWSCAPPRCRCGLPLRPCVLMFADEDAALLRFLGKGTDAYQRWEDAMEATIESAGGGRLVILELGVGRRVEVVRQECEAVACDVAAKGGEVTLIRVNVDAGLTGGQSESPGAECSGKQRLICLQMTAQEALQGMEEVLSTCHAT